MKTLLGLAAAAALQLESPEALIECAEAVKDHNAMVDEMSVVLKSYGDCMTAGRVDACTAEFRQLEETQGRYELLIERLRRHCPEDQLREVEGRG